MSDYTALLTGRLRNDAGTLDCDKATKATKARYVALAALERRSKNPKLLGGTLHGS